MKTTAQLQIITALFLGTFFQAQQENDKLAECKSITIQLFQGNNSVSKDLTKCLVSLGQQGGNGITEYNKFSESIASQTQESLKKQLENLESQRAFAHKNRENAQTAMINNVSQNIITQTQNFVGSNGSQNTNKKSTTYQCDDCPAGTQR